MLSEVLKRSFFLVLFITLLNSGKAIAEGNYYCCRHSETVLSSVFGITEIVGEITIGPVITLPSSGTGPEGGLGAPQDIHRCSGSARTNLSGFAFGICLTDESEGWYEWGTVRGTWKGTYAFCVGIPKIGSVTLWQEPFSITFIRSMCTGCCML